MTLTPEQDHERWAAIVSAKKRKKNDNVDFTLLDGMSESELVAIALDRGIHGASRRMLPEDLIAVIMGSLEDSPEDPLGGVRARTYAYVHGNPRLSKAEMLCDAECLRCPQHIVMACYAVNEDLVDQSTYKEMPNE